MVLAPFFVVLSRFSVIAICLILSWFCLMIWLGFHCFGMLFIVLAMQEQCNIYMWSLDEWMTRDQWVTCHEWMNNSMGWSMGWLPFSCVGICWHVGISLVPGPLFFIGFAIGLLVFAIRVACFSIGLVMVLAPFFIVLSRCSVFAICLGLSWFCLMIWLGFHCFCLFSLFWLFKSNTTFPVIIGWVIGMRSVDDLSWVNEW